MANHWPVFLGYSFLLTLAVATIVGSHRIIKVFYTMFLRLVGDLNRAFGIESIGFEPLVLEPLTLEPLALEI